MWSKEPGGAAIFFCGLSHCSEVYVAGGFVSCCGLADGRLIDGTGLCVCLPCHSGYHSRGCITPNPTGSTEQTHSLTLSITHTLTHTHTITHSLTHSHPHAHTFTHLYEVVKIITSLFNFKFSFTNHEVTMRQIQPLPPDPV